MVQKHIAQKVNGLIELCDALKSKLKKAVQRLLRKVATEI